MTTPLTNNSYWSHDPNTNSLEEKEYSLWSGPSKDTFVDLTQCAIRAAQQARSQVVTVKPLQMHSYEIEHTRLEAAIRNVEPTRLFLHICTTGTPTDIRDRVNDVTNIDAKTSQGDTALALILKNKTIDSEKKVALVTHLVREKNANVNTPDSENNTALAIVLRSKDKNFNVAHRVDLINILVGADADITREDSGTKTALIRVLEADKNRFTGADKANLITHILRGDKPDRPIIDQQKVLKKILESKEYTIEEKIRVVDALLAARANAAIYNSHGDTALTQILKSRELSSEDTVRLFNTLMTSKPDINTADSKGETALLIVLKNPKFTTADRMALVTTLLDAPRADVNKLDANKDSALAIVLKNQDKKFNSADTLYFVNAFIKKGADVNLRTSEEKTLVEFALKNKQLTPQDKQTIINMLVAQGANTYKYISTLDTRLEQRNASNTMVGIAYDLHVETLKAKKAEQILRQHKTISALNLPANNDTDLSAVSMEKAVAFIESPEGKAQAKHDIAAAAMHEQMQAEKERLAKLARESSPPTSDGEMEQQ